MDVYTALADFDWEDKWHNVLCFRRGDRFEVLEDESRRFHQDWWGVRRLGDDVVGYVPSKYVEYEEKQKELYLPEDFMEQRERHVKRLEDMQQDDNYMLPDIYKLPPLEIQSFDDWKKDSRDDVPVPQPDYSGSDDDSGPEDRLPDRNSQKASALTQDEWQKIVNAAETDDLGFPDPPTLDVPEPDYPYDDYRNGGTPGSTPGHSPRLQHRGGGNTQGIIEPKKLVNPSLDSKEKQRLHRELLMNQKMGIDVLRKKSELKKEFDRRAEVVKKKEMDDFVRNKRSPFEVKLSEQASKMQLYEHTGKDKLSKGQMSDAKSQPEFLRVHSKIYKSKATSS